MRPAFVLVFALVLAGACRPKSKSKHQDAAAARPPEMSIEERTRNTDACRSYATQVCTCAKAHAESKELAELCKYDQTLPDALDLAIAIAMNPESSPKDVRVSQASARKIATQCFESLARLPTLGCR